MNLYAAEDLVTLLRQRAQDQAERRAYTFLSDGEQEEETFSCSQLDQRARAIAARLQRTVAPGDRVLLLYPPGLEYIAAFFGCLYAGAVAVPAYPPRHNRNQLRLQTLVTDARAKTALTSTHVLSRMSDRITRDANLARLSWISSDEIANEQSDGWCAPHLSGDNLVLLQYTSGSTTTPKGVMINHRNILSNERLIEYAFSQSSESVVVGWLPLYHDMGLIGNVIQPLFVGAPCVLMSPLAFLQKPLRWLQAISRYRATTSGGPNFAYDLCVRKIGEEQLTALDLSSWKVAFNGAEPIRASTLEAFTEKFAPCGFRREAFRPCYGLAEATLIVSGSPEPRSPLVKLVSKKALDVHRVANPDGIEDQYPLISSGRVLPGEQVRIANPVQLTTCAPEEVGEIWLQSASVAAGYWNSEEQTEETFRAYFADTGEGPFLRTGDLGFFADGELFVTGRLKDLIIIRGLNYYPQDIELSVECCHSALRPSCGAAFSVTLEGEERLVVVQELELRREPEAASAIDAIADAITQEFEIAAHSIVLVRAGSIAKTSSGKIQRYVCRAMFLEGGLQVIAERRAAFVSESQGEPHDAAQPEIDRIEELLCRELAATLKINQAELDLNKPILRYGLDSLLAIELVHRVETELSVTLPLSALLSNQSVVQLAAQLRYQLDTIETRTSSVSTELEYPLSHGEQALWFLHQVAPNNTAYNISRAVVIHSALDAGALRRALQKLVDRHTALRTSFSSQNGTPVQVVHEGIEVWLHEEDASGWNEVALTERLNAEANHTFDLEGHSLLRTHLFTVHARHSVFLMTIHHIVADLWSLMLLLDELGVLYRSELEGLPSPLPPIRRSYGDYVRWQAVMLESNEGSWHRDFWRDQLAGELPSLDIPTDRTRASVRTFAASSHSFQLDAKLVSELKAFAQQRSVTLYTTLLAVFKLLLARYTGQSDIIIGSPTAGRHRAAFSTLVGYFVNLLPLRTTCDANATFDEFLQEVRRTVLAAIEHQDYPLSLLVKHARDSRDSTRLQLFQAVFAWQQAHVLNETEWAGLALSEAGARMRLGNLEIESLALKQRETEFVLTLTMAETNEGVLGTLEYSTELFEAGTIKRMSKHFVKLLESAVNEPWRRVSELDLWTLAERQHLLEQCNQIQVSYPSACLHELFAAQVARTPEAEAVICGAERLSYRELDERARQLAQQLRALRVEPESLVAVLLERSTELVTALLAVLKAGGAYVPLDPAYPQERLGFLLADSGAQVLLTNRRLADVLPEHGANVVYVDDDQTVLQETSELPTRMDPQCLAYVIYTSGSTGEPKGVAVTHANVSRLLAVTETAFGFGNADVWTLFHSYAFDFSVWELWGALAYGGRLVVVPYWVSRNPEQFLKLLDAERVTVLNQTPSAFWQLMQAEGETKQAAALKSLRWVIFGGEALEVTKLSAWFERHGDQRPTLVNMYGITETTVHVTLQVLRREMEAGPGSPVGEPLDDLRVYILDQRQQLLPLGIRGELYVGGGGVAREYLNRPSLTAERFVPDPFSREPGARLYRTGDLGRRLARGGLEYLGRADQQVKIRGFRIELGEIEAALLECAGVHEAAVLLRDKEERAQLVAYVVSDGEEAGGIASLRVALQQRLPEYMVPAAFVQLEQMPLTANGKLDRSALLALRPESAAACGDRVSPRSQVEKIVAETWQQVLGVERVGIYDNFFALGGDSILSLQIVSRLNQAGLVMTPQDLFHHPTVAEFSAVLEHTPAVHAEPGPVSGAVPLTAIQHWFFEQQFAEAHHWNQAVMFEVREALDRAALKRAISRLLEQHDALRLRFVRQGDGWQQVNAEREGETPLTIVELNGLSEADQRRTIELAASKWQTSLNLSEGPLVRAVYFEADLANARRLLLIIHHLVVDAVSWRILFEDLERAYGQAASGLKIAFARKTTSFKQWAERLQAYAEAGDARAEAEYWLSDRWLKADPLPVDLDPWSTGEATATPNSEASANTVRIDFEIEETDALLHKTAQVFRTRVVEMLLAALGRALWCWCRARFVLLDVESHGRESIFEGVNVSRTVGWFTTIYPVLLETGGADRDEVDVLKSVKEQLRQVPHHGIGYGALRHVSGESATARSLRARPRTQMLFNYLGQLDRGLPEHAVFRISADSVGPVRSRRAQRSHLLEINSYIAGGRLRVEWKYSEDIHRRVTIERLSESFKNSLRALLAHTQSPGVFELTPSDFPMVQLSREQLEGALAEVTFDD